MFVIHIAVRKADTLEHISRVIVAKAEKAVSACRHLPSIPSYCLPMLG